MAQLVKHLLYTWEGLSFESWHRAKVGEGGPKNKCGNACLQSQCRVSDRSLELVGLTPKSNSISKAKCVEDAI